MVRFELLHLREEDAIRIRYSEEDYKDFELLFKSAGMQLKRTVNVFNKEYMQSVWFYEANDSNEKMIEELEGYKGTTLGIRLVDDLKKNIFTYKDDGKDAFNIGIFRVIPFDNSESVFPLGHRLSMSDFTVLKEVLVRYCSYLAAKTGMEYIEVKFGKGKQ